VVTEAFLPSPTILAVVVSIDIFAVSFSLRLSEAELRTYDVSAVAIIFGIGSAAMLIGGWAAAGMTTFGQSNLCQVIAAMLLMTVGVRNIRTGLMSEGEPVLGNHCRWFGLVALSMATGMDSAVVGAAMAMGEIELVGAAFVFALIGCGASVAGSLLAKTVSGSVSVSGQLIGGIVLFVMGLAAVCV